MRGMPGRRGVLLGAGMAAVDGVLRQARADLPLAPGLPAGTRAEAMMEALPGKRPLIKLTWRPPNYETPLDAFVDPITPNDRFFVRYHLAGVPTREDLAGWSLTVGGPAAERTLRFTLDELKALPQVEMTAICQCSGNRRGLFAPHVPGVQWGSGAMGAAVWRGVRLADVLARAGVRASAVEVAFHGADRPVLEATQTFRKSIPMALATDPRVLLAFAMNGEAVPIWNGYPVRLVVPGWTGTYWIKHVTEIELRDQPLDSIWMSKTYRVPRGMFPASIPFPSQDDEKTSPITEIVVNSLITAPLEGARVEAGGFELRGLAWDGGHGIRSVDVSTDGGAHWVPATLGKAAGPFAFCPFSARIVPPGPGRLAVLTRATSRNGTLQPAELRRNPAGYHDNRIQSVTVSVG
jgi:sulfite dehydrogenase